jgi:hypothetical protein
MLSYWHDFLQFLYVCSCKVSISVSVGSLMKIRTTFFWKIWSLLKCVLAACPQAGAAYVSIDMISNLKIIRPRLILMKEKLLKIGYS